MDGPGEYYAKWNKPVRERQIPMISLYVDSNEQTELARKMGTESSYVRGLNLDYSGKISLIM